MGRIGVEPPDGARRVLVTGAGGKTGQAVITALRTRGVDAVGLVRDEAVGRRLVASVTGEPRAADRGSRPTARTPPGSVAWAAGDQRRAAHVREAAAGCDAIYAIAPNMTPDEVAMAEAVIDACAARGIQRVVYHSVLDPDEPAMPHHHDKARVEALLAAVDGLAWTFVRPNAYQQNLAGQLDSLRSGHYEVPYDLDRPHAMVDLRDVAQVAADCLADASNLGAVLELSGPQPLSAHDVAAIATSVLRREVVATRVDPDDWDAANAALPADTRRRLHAMFVHYDRHGFPGDPGQLRSLLGREPGHLRDTLIGLLA